MSMRDYAIMWPARPRLAGRQAPAGIQVISPLKLPHAHWQAILNHVRRWWPEEACGLLAGSRGQVERVYLIENVRHSRTDYYMDPNQQVKALLASETAGW